MDTGSFDNVSYVLGLPAPSTASCCESLHDGGLDLNGIYVSLRTWKASILRPASKQISRSVAAYPV